MNNGINKNTIERLHGVLNEYIVKSRYNREFMLWQERKKEQAIQSLKLGKSNTGFKVNDFTNKKESIVFAGRQTSYKNRQNHITIKKKNCISARIKRFLRYYTTTKLEI